MIWLDNSRVIAVFAVVLIHVAMGVVLTNDIGTEYWWIGNVYDSISRWCVPVFVMISGALLLDGNKQESSIIFYNKRLSKILIPILFWTVFYVLWHIVKSHILGSEVTTSGIVEKLLTGTPHYHMWYMYMIIGLYVFTPFFRKIVVNSSNQEIKQIVVISLFFSALTYAFGYIYPSGPSLFITSFLYYVPFFFLGNLIMREDYTPPKVVLWGVFLSSSVLTSVGCYILALNTDLSTGMYFYGFMSISVIPMSISAFYLLKHQTAPILNINLTKQLSILTFGVYLIHPVFLEVINFLKLGAMSFHPLISVPVITSVVFIASLTATWLLSRIPYFKKLV
ncbi:acyltransferase [Vibrio parahaemolyticus]|uniref:acyltransferase n=1 Tax=Vibrio parahaemolyticus TaxID=670 RepID=UPI00111E9E2C|nr:acyltransferase family protein [Vibrio parahaemolyticus]TOE34567.1 hypothetical protein CGJ46_05120 [Vibrio parahaemolyticus]